mmetsp:Transcript_3660/g.10530  ORF Transcript_3660/g.10530 Transcript_3660/m.10530 type:complete len:287 (-) Transcript_3660:181-1041(-)
MTCSSTSPQRCQPSRRPPGRQSPLALQPGSPAPALGLPVLVLPAPWAPVCRAATEPPRHSSSEVLHLPSFRPSAGTLSSLVLPRHVQLMNGISRMGSSQPLTRASTTNPSPHLPLPPSTTPTPKQPPVAHEQPPTTCPLSQVPMPHMESPLATPQPTALGPLVQAACTMPSGQKWLRPPARSTQPVLPLSAGSAAKQAGLGSTGSRCHTLPHTWPASKWLPGGEDTPFAFCFSLCRRAAGLLRGGTWAYARMSRVAFVQPPVASFRVTRLDSWSNNHRRPLSRLMS